MTPRRTAVLLIVLAAVVPYLPTLNDYFAQDDFGVVALLSAKPAGYFPTWFTIPWTEDIWGYVPDEVRPFPAVTYQFAGVFGASSPVANHVINVLFHLINALLVFRLAQAAAGLSLWPAAFAGLVFAVLPMQTESVAWVTGRVDSMPACFYMAAFLLYVRWRETGGRHLYAWAAVWYFVALFTKQNTITLLPALVLADWLVLGHPPRITWQWIRPYVVFAVMTAAFLAQRYVLFGEVARESLLTADRIRPFPLILSNHLKRMILGEPGVRMAEAAFAMRAAAVALVMLAVQRFAGDRSTRRLARPAWYFGLVWIGLAVAPTVVAGYSSPRHMYLASAGYAVLLGVCLEVFWQGRPAPMVRRLGIGLGSAVLVAYLVLLGRDVNLWRVRTEVSRLAVRDVEREALAAPPGSLILVDAPRRSWDFALPHAIRPPFVGEDIPTRVFVVSRFVIHCCPAWEEYTRNALRTWIENPARPPVIALQWDADTGVLSRLSDREDPSLRPIVSLLLETRSRDALDQLLADIIEGNVVGRHASRPPRL